MKIDRKGVALRLAVAAILPVAMIAPAQAAEPVLVKLTAPAGLKGVPALPFTGVKSATFTQSSTANMLNMDVTPNQGPGGTKMVVTGKGLPASTSVSLVWSTADGYWAVDPEPNTVNYTGVGYNKYFVDMAKVTTDATGGLTFSSAFPEDFGGVHDIYAVVDGVAIAHGGVQMNPTISISPKSGPIGTPITITYKGMGPNLYTGGVSVLWDNSFAGEAQAIWTRGTATFTIRAAGPVGKHYIASTAGIGVQYMNIKQSPVPFAKGDKALFTTTKDNGAAKASIQYPELVTPSITSKTTWSEVGLDPATKAVAALSTDRGVVGSKTKLNVTGLSSDTPLTLTWATVVGNRVNCTGTCWVYNGVPMGTVTPVNGVVNTDVTIPDHLGGWHVIQLKKGDLIEAQVAYYVQESIFAYTDKNGKTLSLGLAKAEDSNMPEDRNGSGTPTMKFKAGEEFTIAMKGVGWTQLDNTMAVTYDNSYIGYGCGFNSNGYMVVHLTATGAPGTHIIDLSPVLYTNQPSYANTPYGMLPVLTNMNDIPGLALGYQPPKVHFEITIVK